MVGPPTGHVGLQVEGHVRRVVGIVEIEGDLPHDLELVAVGVGQRDPLEGIWQQVAVGAVLIIAVYIDQLRRAKYAR